MTKEDLYQLAYKTHYNDKDLDKAEQLYLKLIEEFPNTQEVGYAKSQLTNIKKAKLTLNSNNEEKFKTQFDQLSAYKNVYVSTTPFIAGYEEVKTIDIVTSECVYGMNIFSDLFASLSDIFGGRSATTQNILKEARINCLNELRKEAYELGGNAVVGVNLEYSEFSGKGKSMLFLVASGTAVVVEKKELL